jgi:hypothetical protein
VLSYRGRHRILLCVKGLSLASEHDVRKISTTASGSGEAAVFVAVSALQHISSLQLLVLVILEVLESTAMQEATDGNLLLLSNV